MSIIKYTSKCYCVNGSSDPFNDILDRYYCYYCLALCCGECYHIEPKKEREMFRRIICASCAIQGIDCGTFCCMLCDQISPVGFTGIINVYIHETSTKHICKVCVSAYNLHDRIKNIRDTKHVYSTLTDIRCSYIKNIEQSASAYLIPDIAKIIAEYCGYFRQISLESND